MVLLMMLFSLLMPARVSIAVAPRTFMAGSSVRITCTVPKDATNRWLGMGVTGYTSSEINLEGAEAPVTRSMYFHHVPCDTGNAWCEVIDAMGNHYTSTKELVVGGCGI